MSTRLSCLSAHLTKQNAHHLRIVRNTENLLSCFSVPSYGVIRTPQLVLKTVILRCSLFSQFIFLKWATGNVIIVLPSENESRIALFEGRVGVAAPSATRPASSRAFLRRGFSVATRERGEGATRPSFGLRLGSTFLLVPLCSRTIVAEDLFYPPLISFSSIEFA